MTCVTARPVSVLIIVALVAALIVFSPPLDSTQAAGAAPTVMSTCGGPPTPFNVHGHRRRQN